MVGKETPIMQRKDISKSTMKAGFFTPEKYKKHFKNLSEDRFKSNRRD